MREDPLNPDDPFLRLENQNIALQSLIKQFNRNLESQIRATALSVGELAGSFHVLKLAIDAQTLHINQIDSDVHIIDTDLTKMRNYVRERFDTVDQRFDDIDTWRGSADQRFESIDTKLDAVLAAVGGNT